MEDWQNEFLNITWEEFRQQAFTLSQKISQTGQKYDLIVAISRGGLTLSQLLSDALNLPIAAFTIQSYKDLQQNNLPHITHRLSASLANKKILLVDDISDSGKTFKRALAHLVDLDAQNKDIHTAALYLKPKSVYRPDYFFGETDKWVIYPYEVRETIAALVKKWKQSGLDYQEMKHRFELLKFPEVQIDYFLNG